MIEKICNSSLRTMVEMWISGQGGKPFLARSTQTETRSTRVRVRAYRPSRVIRAAYKETVWP